MPLFTKLLFLFFITAFILWGAWFLFKSRYKKPIEESGILDDTELFYHKNPNYGRRVQMDISSDSVLN